MKYFAELDYKLPIPKRLLNLGFVEKFGGNDLGYLVWSLSDSDRLVAWISPPDGEYRFEREYYTTQQYHRFEILYMPARPGTLGPGDPCNNIHVLVYAGNSAAECVRSINRFLGVRNGKPLDVVQIANALPGDYIFSAIEAIPMDTIIAHRAKITLQPFSSTSR